MNLTTVVDKVVQISDFNKNPSRFLDEVASGTPITITQGRKANAILVPREAWARLLVRLQELENELETRELLAGLQELENELETRELLADPKVQQRLREGLPARGIPLAEARSRLRSHRKRR